jgi:hypothetical protein
LYTHTNGSAAAAGRQSIKGRGCMQAYVYVCVCVSLRV